MTDKVAFNGASGPLSADEAAELSHQIAELTSAGLPLAGLGCTGRGVASRPAPALDERPGRTLRQACLSIRPSGTNKAESRLISRLVIAGIPSGSSEISNRFAAYVSVGTELKRRLWLSLAYPALTASCAFALFVLVCVFIVRQFKLIYRDFNIPLPTITRAVIDFADVVDTVLSPVMIVAGALRRMAGGPPSPETARVAAWRAGFRCSEWSGADVTGGILSPPGLVARE